VPRPPLKGEKALVVGIANERSIAYGCARAFHEPGAELAITYVNEKTQSYGRRLSGETPYVDGGVKTSRHEPEFKLWS